MESSDDFRELPIKEYKVPSATRLGVFYTIIDWGTDLECECESFRYRGKCHHIDRVNETPSKTNFKLDI